MTIPRIHIKEVDIPNIYTPDWMSHQSNVEHLVPPVVLNIGNPIVDMPGCVKMHRDNQYHNNGLPIDRNLVENDPDRAMTVCDAEVPSYDAMNYEPDQLQMQIEAAAPPVIEPPPAPDIDPPEVPSNIPTEVPCPGPAQLRVGDLTQSGDEKVVGHELSQDGQICVTLYEPTTPAEKFLPSVNQASTTLAIAVIATAGAAATPLLLRLIKPAVKKAISTLQKKRGQHRELSRNERQTNRYREKKGLPPFKIPKKSIVNRFKGRYFKKKD